MARTGWSRSTVERLRGDLANLGFMLADGYVRRPGSRSPEHTLRIIFDKVCADASFLPKIAFEGMDIATLRGLIGAGLGIGLFPPAPARLAGVVEIKLSPARPIRPLGIGWVDHRYLPASAIEFRKFVVSKFHGE